MFWNYTNVHNDQLNSIASKRRKNTTKKLNKERTKFNHRSLKPIKIILKGTIKTHL